MDPKILYVDIDGTLTVETEGHNYHERSPRFDVINKVNYCYHHGWTVILWTARWPVDRKVTVLWLDRWGVRYHNLVLGKPTWDLYICDKSVNVEDWLNAS